MTGLQMIDYVTIEAMHVIIITYDNINSAKSQDIYQINHLIVDIAIDIQSITIYTHPL